MVALGSASATGATLFAKNSDRSPNEVHEVVSLPRKTYSYWNYREILTNAAMIPDLLSAAHILRFRKRKRRML